MLAEFPCWSSPRVRRSGSAQPPTADRPAAAAPAAREARAAQQPDPLVRQMDFE